MKSDRDSSKRCRADVVLPSGERPMAGGAVVRLLVLCVVTVLGSGCAGYTANVEDAKRDVIYGETDRAVGKLNEVLGTEERHQIPGKLTGENTLILLERATLLQAMGEYKLAARDMMIADQQLDWLDIGAQGKAKVGKYLFSGSAVKYRAPPYERLLLNTMNMINFLALGDYEEAKVEARRFTIIEQFFQEDESKTLLPGSLGFGNYLGGVAFEAAGDYRKAARYYTKAWKYGVRTGRFEDRLVNLCRMVAYKPSEIIEDKDGELARLDRQVSSGEALSFDAYRDEFVDGEVLVVVQTGLVPYKKAKRYPIYRALRYAEAHAWGAITLAASTRTKARELAVSGALKYVNFPVLTEDGLPSKRSVKVETSDGLVRDHLGINVSRQVEHAWDRISGPLMVAAITRMITRAVAGAATREGVKAASNDSGLGSLLGSLAQVAVEGGMAAADTPDTRSWSLLPARMQFSRVKMPPGQHSLTVRVNSRTYEETVEVKPGGPVLLNFSKHR
jgi:hypothetical protein